MQTRHLTILALLLPLSTTAQIAPPTSADTTHKYQNPTGISSVTKNSFFKSKGFRAAVVPALLIGYGATTINGNGFYSSYNVHNDVRHVFGNYRNHIDDFLQWAPYLEIPAVLLAGVKSHNDRVNLGLILIKSEAIMLGSVYIVKTLTHVQRPDGSDNLSFPSGHTATGFFGRQHRTH